MSRRNPLATDDPMDDVAQLEVFLLLGASRSRRTRSRSTLLLIKPANEARSVLDRSSKRSTSIRTDPSSRSSVDPVRDRKPRRSMTSRISSAVCLRRDERVEELVMLACNPRSNSMAIIGNATVKPMSWNRWEPSAHRPGSPGLRARATEPGPVHGRRSRPRTDLDSGPPKNAGDAATRARSPTTPRPV